MLDRIRIALAGIVATLSSLVPAKSRPWWWLWRVAFALSPHWCWGPPSVWPKWYRPEVSR